MKKFFLATLAALSLTVCLYAQEDMLRYNYKKNNYIYTAAERVRVEGSTPLDMKLSRVIFPDGEPLYILRIDYIESTAWKMPVNAPFTALLSSGRSVVLKNSATEPTAVAPAGVVTGSGRKYWNYGEYLLEQDSIDKLLSGVTSLDVTKRWSADGTIKIQYRNDEFSSALKQQWDAISKAPKPTQDIGKQLKSISDQSGNRLVETNKIDVNAQLGVALVYLYYAENNSENYDLNLYLQGITVPMGSNIYITTTSGRTIELHQEKELPAGRVICYPTVDELKLMERGVSRISIDTPSRPVNINLTGASFGEAISLLYNSLQTASIL